MPSDPAIVYTPGVPWTAAQVADLARRLSAVERGQGGSTISGLTSGGFQDGSIPGAAIQAGTITTVQVAANAIAAPQIQAGAITANKLAAGSVTANAVAANAIQAGAIAAGSLDGYTITGGSFRTAPDGTYPRLVMDSGGLRAEQSASLLTFNLSANGSLTLSGKVTAEAGSSGLQNIGGVVNAPQVGFTVGGGNLVPNSTFNNGTTGMNGTNLTNQPGTIGPAGTPSVSIRGTGSLASFYPAAMFPISPRHDYVCSCYVQPASGATTRSPYMQVEWYTSSGSMIRASAGKPVPETAGQWVRLSATGYSDDNARYARAVVVYPTTANGEVHYINAIQFEPGQVPTAYKPLAIENNQNTVGQDQVAPDAIGNNELAPDAVANDNIQQDSISANEIIAGSITSTELRAGAIDSFQITSPKIRTSATHPMVYLDNTGIYATNAQGAVVNGMTTNHVAPGIAAAMGSAYTLTQSWATWPGAQKTILVGAGRTLQVMGGGQMTQGAWQGVSGIRLTIGYAAGPPMFVGGGADVNMWLPVQAAATWHNTGGAQNITVGIQVSTLSQGFAMVAQSGYLLWIVE